MKATLIIRNIGALATLQGEDAPRRGVEQGNVDILNNGVIAVDGDRIIYVGTGEIPEEISITAGAEVIDAKGKLVTPGLIDSHTHLVHGGSREHELSMKLKGAKYLEILNAGGGIHSTMKSTREMSFDDLYDQSKKSLDIMLSYGVTTVESKSGYGVEDFDTELKQLQTAAKLNREHPVDVIPTFMGAHAIPLKYKDDPEKFVSELIERMIPDIGRRDLAKFCDVFCEEGVFTIDQSRRILLAARNYGMIPKIHADEIESLGGAELSAELKCISADHLVGASDDGIRMMAREGVIANLLPGTSFNLQSGKHARARYMIDNNLPIAISSDYNPGSCPTENLQLIMSMASIILRMTPEEVLTATTINAACALGLENEVGSIQVGKKADITIFDVKNLEYLIYHFGINHTEMVIKEGKIVYKA